MELHTVKRLNLEEPRACGQGYRSSCLYRSGGVRDAVVLLDRCLLHIADSHVRGVKAHGDLATQDLVYFILWLVVRPATKCEGPCTQKYGFMSSESTKQEVIQIHRWSCLPTWKRGQCSYM